MVNFLAVGIGLLAIFVISKIISYLSLRLGVAALGVATVIFLYGLMG